MALIRFGEGQQRSGSLGGSVYSHNRYGAYIRARSVPVNPSSDRQVAVRGYLQAISIAWNNVLTQVQRDAWEVYAGGVTWRNRLGDMVHLTGLAHYIRSNAPRLLCGLARIDVAPNILTIATAEQALVVTASEATQQLSIAYDDTQAWCDEDGAFQIFYAGIPQNASRTFFGGPYRHLTCIEGDSITPPASPEANVDVPNWPFGEGQRIWVRSRIGRADGRLSEFAQANFLAAA
jgi:hypothetical protein